MVNTRLQTKMAQCTDLLAMLAELKKSMHAGHEDMRSMRAGQEEMKDRFRTRHERIEQKMEQGQEEMKRVQEEIIKVQEEIKNQFKGVHGEIEEVQRKNEEVEDKVQGKISFLEKRISDLYIRPNIILEYPELLDIRRSNVMDCFQSPIQRCELCEPMGLLCESQ
ncbi:hypothetical protein AVEN_152048-1 [Araneus ventricosus]|uniref:Uncharacterized protein n=1 Tax=Araneus ventricosus TaxID=182803 RepID=A0A4Y2IB48_ARAVE|nr:hypothetical protein AVEN_161489-1 [Araneus ventricosus]GBM74903.1 hypothetical protein AVEN_152048-1 [Araneus ventricosus]